MEDVPARPQTLSAATRVARRGRGWYRGDCHVHSTRSTAGELTPEQLAAAARQAELDFVAITEHNTADTHAAWAPLAGDDLLVIVGQEVATRTGHWLALGVRPGQVVEWRYGVRDDAVERYLDEVRNVGGICVAAHPHAPYPSGVFMYQYEQFDVVEVWNGSWASDQPWNADNEAALAEWGRGLSAGIRRGRWMPAMGNSDTHLRGQIGVPRTVVLGEELSADSVLAGIRAGRSWIAASASVELSLAVSAGDRRVGVGDRRRAGLRPSRRARCAVRRRQLPHRRWHGASGVVAAHRIRGSCVAYQRGRVDVRPCRGPLPGRPHGGTHEPDHPCLSTYRGNHRGRPSMCAPRQRRRRRAATLAPSPRSARAEPSCRRRGSGP